MRIALRSLVLIATASVLASCAIPPPQFAGADITTRIRGLAPDSVSNAYTFLDLMMDKYAKGDVTRLVRSFDGGGVGNFTDAVTYDDALMIDALLARGDSGDISRAQVIGNAFLYVQQYDPEKDGRLRAAYEPKPLLKPGDIVPTDDTSDLGNMAWVGQSLVRLYAKTHNAGYLNGAIAIGNWVQTNTYDSRGAGGYTGGYTSSGKKIKWKSTEHNIDVFAFFSMLATETGDGSWTSRADWARQFVASMWDAGGRRFYVGTLDDGITPNKSFKPEDVNSWSYLAFADPQWASSIDWDVTNLAVNRGGFSGVSFCSGDRSGVWFEGTAHLADALLLRNDPGDSAKAKTYIGDVAYAQTNGPNNDGLGIIAASKNRLSDCDGDFYYASLHVGATAWYIMAVGSFDPFRLP